MGQIRTVIDEWCSESGDKRKLYAGEPDLVLRWLNEGHLRFADISEIINGTWSPTITSDGYIALPADFLREYQNRVKLDSSTILRNIPYEDALNITSFGGVSFYSIFNNTFYVWEATACTPTIPYIKKPAVVTSSVVTTADLEIPTEFHFDLLTYLDGRYLRKVGKLADALILLKEFDRRASEAGTKFRNRRNTVPIMKSTRF